MTTRDPAAATRPLSAQGLRERLTQLRRDRGDVVPRADQGSALADLPKGIAQSLSPSLADRLARLRPWLGKERSSRVDPADVAQCLGGELIDAGVVRIEHTYPLPLQHGRASLNNAFVVPGALFADEKGAPVAASDTIFLDTETTGLSGGTGTVAFMIGIARFTTDALHVTQWLITTFAGERAMLAALAGQLADGALIVTFNGASFDLPLLRTRFRMHHLADPTIAHAHADLLPWARRNRLKDWPDARLQTLEREGLGFHRVDDLPGAEVPKAWQQWLTAGETAPLRRALEHNRLDLVTLVALLERASQHPLSPRRKTDPRQAWLFERATPWPPLTTRMPPSAKGTWMANPWVPRRSEALQSVL
jgi:uncharacterized protein